MTTTSLEKFLRNFNSNEICWYPSAGTDIKNVELWNNKYGNELKPRLFVYSDISYKISPENIKPVNNPNDNNQLNFTPEMRVEQIKFVDYNFLDEDVINMYKRDLVNPNIEFDDFLMSMNENPENQQERDAIRDVFDMGLLSNENDDPIRIKNYYSQQPDALQIEYYNVTILFIKSTNKKLFDFFARNQIKISCFMAKRSMDHFIDNFDGFKNLSIKEVIAREKYLCNLKKSGYRHLDNEIIWNSYEYNDTNNFVWKIQ